MKKTPLHCSNRFQLPPSVQHAIASLVTVSLLAPLAPLAQAQERSVAHYSLENSVKNGDEGERAETLAAGNSGNAGSAGGELLFDKSGTTRGTNTHAGADTSEPLNLALADVGPSAMDSEASSVPAAPVKTAQPTQTTPVAQFNTASTVSTSPLGVPTNGTNADGTPRLLTPEQQQNRNAARDPNGTARAMAGGTADRYAQQWLNKIGTAQINSGVGNGFKNGAFDLLVPMWDRPNDLLFTQYGVRRSDEYTESYRTTVNFGIGYRHLIAGGWMLGSNAFYDRDLTRSNERLGVGLEAKRNFLSLSANGYLRLSNWRNSDLVGYLERPANGFDVRATGYLPAYPQLGATLRYEKYYGSNVGLFGPGSLQKNPNAVTVGLLYQPIPLVGVGVQYRQGNGGLSEVYGNVQLTYQLGMPFADQLKSSKVIERRLLSTTRYALVDRNNEIVMQYRKIAQPVRTPSAVALLAAPTLIAATGTTTSMLTATVRDRNGNALGAGVTVNWKTDVGTLAQASSVTDASGQATNVLTSSTTAAVADVVASVGEATSDTNVTFSSTTATYSASVVSAASSIATGGATTTLTATVKDSTGKTVGAGVAVNWTTTAGSLSAASSTTNAEGKASITLSSGSVATTANVTANVPGGTASASVAFTSSYQIVSMSESSVATLPFGSAVNSPGNVVRIEADVSPSSGSGTTPAGVVVTFSASGGTLSSTSQTTTADGLGDTYVDFTIPADAAIGQVYFVTAQTGTSTMVYEIDVMSGLFPGGGGSVGLL